MAKEYIEKVFTKFEDHLNLANNNRIIFSGKFGIGKSYFLNEFFKDEKYKTEYFPIFIDPVNYSVSNNQDIFELIKFDILFQILNKDIVDFDNFDFPTGNLVYQYFSNKFLNDFISNTDLLGETVIDEQLPKSYSILKNLGKLISKISEVSKRDFNKFKKEIEANPDLKIIKNFFDKEETKIGSVYENNAVTQLIYQLIKSIEAKTEKKTVLIIDDLDRIDPEHIFRILNIFSAHDRENENKFGFEKIVLVCDIKNIESIYHHFYGINTDFFGYINKFYSVEPYHYSNEDYFLIFEKDFNSENKFHFNENAKIKFLKYIIGEAIRYNYITARILFNNDFSKQNIFKKYDNYIRMYYDRTYFKGKHITFFNIYREYYTILLILTHLLGNSKKVQELFMSLERESLVYYEREGNIIANLLGLAKLYKPTENSLHAASNFYGLTLRSTQTNFLVENPQSISSFDLTSFLKDLFEVIDNIIVL